MQLSPELHLRGVTATRHQVDASEISAGDRLVYFTGKAPQLTEMLSDAISWIDTEHYVADDGVKHVLSYTLRSGRRHVATLPAWWRGFVERPES